MFQSILKWRLKTKLLVGVILLVVLVIVFFSTRGTTPQYELFTVSRADLVQEVAVNATVKPSQELTLAFETAGLLADLSVQVGQTVIKGQVLAALDDQELATQLAQAEADQRASKAKVQQLEAALQAEQIKLVELQRGLRAEELQVYQAKFSNALSTLQLANSSLLNSLQDALVKADDAIYNNADQLFDNPKSYSVKFKYSTINYNFKAQLESERLALENLFASWRESADTLTAASAAGFVSNSTANLEQVKTFLDDLAVAVNSLKPDSTLPQTTIDGYKTDVAAARTGIATTISAVSSAQDKLNSAQAALNVAQDELNLQLAGSSDEQIQTQLARLAQATGEVAAQQAQYQKAQLEVQRLRIKLQKTKLRAPFNGLITKKSAEQSEIVAAGQKIVGK